MGTAPCTPPPLPSICEKTDRGESVHLSFCTPVCTLSRAGRGTHLTASHCSREPGGIVVAFERLESSSASAWHRMRRAK